jgi:hypothetical protein
MERAHLKFDPARRALFISENERADFGSQL